MIFNGRKAIIYQTTKTAMQSGKAKTKYWHKKVEPVAPNDIDVLMGRIR